MENTSKKQNTNQSTLRKTNSNIKKIAPIKIKKEAPIKIKKISEKQKLLSFDRKFQEDYKTMIESTEVFFAKYNSMICGIDILIFRGSWKLRFSFDDTKKRNQALA